MTGNDVIHRGNRSLILFVREPRAGQVKSRLVPELGEAGALALYRQMLSRQIRLVNDFSCHDRQLWVAGSPGHEDFNSFHGGISLQEGPDIGARMDHALRHALTSSEAAVLIGCDCPAMDKAYIELAFRALEAGNDAVFGPAVDGGYVLVGLKKACPDIFRHIDWGTDKVMAQTRATLSDLGLAWKELPPLPDIDDPGDLVLLPGDWTAGRMD